jgi:hypothetical protein
MFYNSGLEKNKSFMELTFEKKDFKNSEKCFMRKSLA